MIVVFKVRIWLNAPFLQLSSQPDIAGWLDETEHRSFAKEIDRLISTVTENLINRTTFTFDINL